MFNKRLLIEQTTEVVWSRDRPCCRRCRYSEATVQECPYSDVISYARMCFVVNRWRGSIYKFVWQEFLLFAGLYFLISIIYRFALDENAKKYEHFLWNYEIEYRNDYLHRIMLYSRPIVLYTVVGPIVLIVIISRYLKIQIGIITRFHLVSGISSLCLFVNLILAPVPTSPAHLFLHPSLLPLLIHHFVHL